jgi:tetratricopeptide (TPR) repeat protein
MTHRLKVGKVLGFTLVALVVAAIGISSAQETASSPETEGNPEKLTTKCEYGVTLALAGEMDTAEQVFTSLLSDSPGDARAYNNLGNIHFLRGELEVALVFYERGKGADDGDAGIMLNCATTLMLLGEEERARTEVAEAARLAGGIDKLSGLIGLESSPEDVEVEETSKASEKAYVSREEVSALIAGSLAPMASGEAGADSLGAAEDQAEAPKKRARLWRSSSPKAADDTEAALVLYWKN